MLSSSLSIFSLGSPSDVHWFGCGTYNCKELLVQGGIVLSDASFSVVTLSWLIWLWSVWNWNQNASTNVSVLRYYWDHL